MIDLVKPVDTLSQGLEERECGMVGGKTEKKREMDGERWGTLVGRCDQEM